jgi:hypothetical protein
MGIRALVRTSMVSGVAVLGLALSPLAAHASASLSGTGQAWGANTAAAEANANSQAYSSLLSAASSHGFSTCVNVTYSDTLYYAVPSGGGYVYNSTATGLCGNLVFQAGATLSATGQALGATPSAGQANAESLAHSNLLSAASARGYTTCINITYSDSLYYVVPSGGGYVYNSTATGSCGTQVLQ